MTHLIKRKHFVAAKYIDRLDDIISHPDYAGCYNGNIEEQAGFQLNIAKWDEEFLRLWNTPAHTPAFFKE